MAKLEQLFGLQKIAENKELNTMINDTHERYGSAMELDDDMLDKVSGGTNTNQKQVVNHFCPTCNCMKEFRLASGGRAFCNTCNTSIVL